MWKCPKCNYVMQDSDQFCNDCGEKKPKSVQMNSYKKNFIAQLCMMAATVVIIFTLIIGFVAGNLLGFLLIWGSGIITGIILLALAEIIRLLENSQNS